MNIRCLFTFQCSVDPTPIFNLYRSLDAVLHAYLCSVIREAAYLRVSAVLLS